MEKATHSDFLIHWTGNDIEKEGLPLDQSNQAYLKRLKDILSFGLWMREDRHIETLKFAEGQPDFVKPVIARTCFTELKLSESQNHAERFGKLGIGFKRFFLFNRLGSPMFYVQNHSLSLFFPPFTQISQGQYLNHFLINMHLEPAPPWTYNLYNQSEWRIIYSEDIKVKLLSKYPHVASQFVDPKTTSDQKLKNYYNALSPNKRPDYLIPLDAWLAMIIYPNLKVKNMSIDDPDIRKRLKDIAQTPPISGCPEVGFAPIEMNLQACKNF